MGNTKVGPLAHTLITRAQIPAYYLPHGKENAAELKKLSEQIYIIKAVIISKGNKENHTNHTNVQRMSKKCA